MSDIKIVSAFVFLIVINACKNHEKPVVSGSLPDSAFVHETETIEDIQILRYKVDNFDKLSLKQKLFVYYLVQAGLSGRDIVYDQKYKYNLIIRRTFEKILTGFSGDKSTEDWKNLVTYIKLIWASNGIHRRTTGEKILPHFTRDYLDYLLNSTNSALSQEVKNAIFDPKIGPVLVCHDSTKDIIRLSAINFYDNELTEADVNTFLKSQHALDTLTEPRINSKLILNTDGSVYERIWKLDDMYGSAIKKIVFWLEKAENVCENQNQTEALKFLISFCKTGDLIAWNQFKKAWDNCKTGDIDFINSFVVDEFDPLDIKGSFTGIVEIKDFEADKWISILNKEAQWFQDHTPGFEKQRNPEITPVYCRATEVAGYTGNTSMIKSLVSNQAKSDWIRQKYSSSSLITENINKAVEKTRGKALAKEFTSSAEEFGRFQKYGFNSQKAFAVIKDVVGQIGAKPVEEPKSLKNLAVIIESTRKSLIALYFITDPKLVQLNILPDSEAGKTIYDNFITTALLKQLIDVEPGRSLSDPNAIVMKLIAEYAYQKGLKNQVISRITLNGKTFYKVNDYENLRNIFGQLLIEMQRIQSKEDAIAAQNIVNQYGTVVDQLLLAEVKQRAKKLNLKPVQAFIQPEYAIIKDNSGNIKDVKIEYPADFTQQMLNYSKKYSFLPDLN